ncbi:MAG: hypothetical protein A3I29_00045 [Candidatus Magasanikbacteria bacterium RIFCSPLOWO2_02_FULL_44_11]|uniref:DUF4349 domain-containing protein n=2 Tax=Candidatus Magasanikiibacteriota TaxID=1752731 RepID=A0A1F6NC43_9BACT|nr:MAG: hypothetical protein A3D53_01790 [Candidatus Magasanikbacteria bacterium RIFCSPHIGHO2_02_FULL_45_10]OGH81360.1 MAG: hypothetical protein A3I29_00045 [Candidatus Magasanikbacteria bacterium RIFCSPLOWO2_02_FULL_44_11]
MKRRILFIAMVVVGFGVLAYIVASNQEPVQSGLSGRSTGLSFSNQMAKVNSDASENFGAAPATGGNTAPATDRLIVKTGSLSLLVKNVPDAVKAVTNFVTGNGGFVVTSNISKEKDAPYGSMMIRLPAAKFQAGIDVGKSLGEVKNEQTNGQDVTEEFVDLDAQLRILKATEIQFVQLMQRSGSISDILSVQRELMNVRSQIERLEGRMKYLKDSVALSTITLHLSTDPENLPIFEENGKTWKPLAVIKEALRGLISVFKFVGDALIYFVVFIPLWLVIVLSTWLVKKIIKRVSTNKISQ